MLAGRYAHVRELGRGATGRVLLADDRAEGGRRAIKVVPAEHAERLRWEMSLLASVAHPNLARVFELVVVEAALGPPLRLAAGAAALVEEHVDGVSADEAVAARAREPERARFTVEVGLAATRALSALHAAGLVHGDVKPANLVVPDVAAEAKLVDLGLARPQGWTASAGGTPAFLAPEAWLGERTPATDLYALGVTLHALMSGRTAFDTAGSSATVARALVQPPRPEALPASTPLPLRRLIGDLLAERPSERPDSAREAALRLAALARELGLEPPEQTVAAPSGAEKAARVGARPLVGRAEALRRLVACLAEPGLVTVSGPPGAGRTRLVREAARTLQSEAARAGAPVPTFVTADASSPPRLASHAIVLLPSTVADRAACADAIEAAAVEGVRLTVVLEGGLEGEDARVELGPLPPEAFRQLLVELLEVDPSDALRDAAMRASGGLPGRLCRLVADAFEAGLDPSRPATLRTLGAAPAEIPIPEVARPLAERLAVAGGALHAFEAPGPELESQARALSSAGVAHVAADGRLTLRDDVRRALWDQLGERRAEVARAVADAALDATGRAFVALARGDEDGAEAASLEALREARRAGDPERAASHGQESLMHLAASSSNDARPALRLATANALRARAREAEALELLGVMPDDPAACALRAELRRLLGDLDGAASEAARGGTPMAAAVAARVSLSRGEPMPALEIPADAADLDAARLHEVRALGALMSGALDVAARELRAGEARAGEDGAARARIESLWGAVFSAEGRVHEAADRYERAFALADAAGERHAAASFLVNVGLGRLEQGQAGPAIEALREGARRLTELGRRRDAARALYNLGNAAALVGDDDLAADAIRRASVWAEELGDGPAMAYAAVVAAELAVRAGKLGEASRRLDAAWDDETLPAGILATLGARRAIVAAVRGELPAARAALEEATLRGERGAAHVAVQVELEVARARVALAAGAEEDAVEAASRAARAAEGAGWEAGLRAQLALAEALERAGRTPDAAIASARARTTLDAAAATLAPSARARLRTVPAYRRALGAAPAATVAAPEPSRWRVLVRHAKRVVREPRLARLREAVVDAAVELADAERGFWVERAVDGALKVRTARAFGADLEGERPSASVAARALDGGRPMVSVDALEDDRLDAARSVHTMALRSVLAVPVPGAREVALVLDDRLRPGAFDQGVLRLVQDLAEIAAGALERAEALRAQRRQARRLARDKRRLTARVESVERELSSLRGPSESPAFSGIVAESEGMRRTLRLVERLAASDAPVLVRGESGTGKELVARAVHQASSRRDGPYVSENVSAIPDTLLESALFGHVRGAFTGAERARRGLFEVADGGSLFLDEIGEMSESMQAKLLRVLQDGQLRPVGSEETTTVDVRLIAATHRDLERMVEEGAFRQDLFYRVAVVQVELPPLRERLDDVAPLVAAFLDRHAPERRVRVDRGAMNALRAFSWPGNVRELENEIRRALVLADEVIGPEHLSPKVRGAETQAPADALDLKGQVAALERRLIVQALDQTAGNQTRAAELLGLSRYGLQKMMKRLDVPKP